MAECRSAQHSTNTAAAGRDRRGGLDVTRDVEDVSLQVALGRWGDPPGNILVSLSPHPYRDMDTNTNKLGYIIIYNELQESLLA